MHPKPILLAPSVAGGTARIDWYTRRVNSFRLQSKARQAEPGSQALLDLGDLGIAKIGSCFIANVDHYSCGADNYIEVLHGRVR